MNETLQSLTSSSRPVLLAFHAVWCPHCRNMRSTMIDLSALLDGQVEIHRVDIDRFPAIAEEAKVKSVPTFILFISGRPVWRYTGELHADALLGKIEAVINDKSPRQ